MANINKLFLITEGLKGEIKREAFLQRNTDEAKAYFKEYIKNERKYFTLRLIAVFIDNEIKFMNVYVTSQDNTRLKETPKELKEKYEKARYLKNAEQIKILFGGEEINDDIRTGISNFNSEMDK